MDKTKSPTKTLVLSATIGGNHISYHVSCFLSGFREQARMLISVIL